MGAHLSNRFGEYDCDSGKSMLCSAPLDRSAGETVVFRLRAMVYLVSQVSFGLNGRI